MKAEQPLQLVGVISVESVNVKFSIISSSNGNVLIESSKPVELIKLYPEWVEVDPESIWNSLKIIIEEVINELISNDISLDCIKVISIINERDTVVAWDSETNKPLYNAIHYSDNRTDSIIQDYVSKDPNVFKYVEEITGLKVVSMFSALKLKWLFENVDNIKISTVKETVKFGTLDTWLTWKLTNRNLYITDVTNASRTLLMNLKTLKWSEKACKIFNIPFSLLPTIKSNSELYGKINITRLKGIMIGAIIANHQAAFYVKCRSFGQVMSRYNDSCITSCNIGNEVIQSKHGLITSVAYQIGNESVSYALEGWTSVGGKITEWLKNNMKIINSEDELKTLDIDVSDIYIVPAFNGLATPYWRPDATGIICGMTHYTNKKHIIRASLESICFHTKDICIALQKDIGITTSQLMVDGKYSCYDILLNYQADILGANIRRLHATDMAIYGAAEIGAKSVGLEFNDTNSSDFISKPTTTENERNNRYYKWLKAVRRSCGWKKPVQIDKKLNKFDIFSTNILSTAYLVAMMGMMVISDNK
ncbi:probable glycerol kinase [Daktulosphaira vitifoliae]|uniref:probable glycerol kinase n=1 Tax=Daktulosphaira vitifoliae TaxID=58002 RepID=UPI0021AAC105|nr:probable glycerol kinase [Daktulosphaira vitifoliae]